MRSMPALREKFNQVPARMIASITLLRIYRYALRIYRCVQSILSRRESVHVDPSELTLILLTNLGSNQSRPKGKCTRPHRTRLFTLASSPRVRATSNAAQLRGLRMRCIITQKATKHRVEYLIFLN